MSRFLLLLLAFLASSVCDGFVPVASTFITLPPTSRTPTSLPPSLHPPSFASSSSSLSISKKRREELGLAEEDVEYDLDAALATNTDPLITKIIVGSFTLVMVALIVFGFFLPYLDSTQTDLGYCVPMQNNGKC